MKRLSFVLSLAALVVACTPSSDSESSVATTTAGAPTTPPEITIVPTTTTLPTVPPRTYDSTTDLANFFAKYGGEEAFGQPAVAAITTYLGAEDALRAGDPAAADALLDALWRKYPIGDAKWFNTPYSPHGAFVGSPTAYYGLRMLTEVTDQLLNSGEAAAKHIRLTVVLVGCSEGTQSTTEDELDAGTGKQVHLTLNKELDANADEWFDQATWAFRQYVSAITGGKLIVDLGIQRLPDVCAPVFTGRNVAIAAELTTAAPIWDAMPAAVTAATDMWWVVFPSDVPSDGALADTQFVTSGVEQHPSGAPVFLSDDLWMVRKPTQLGKGPYTSVERRAYMAQWMQTEFFHHLFSAAYPEFGLEKNGNDWFNPDNWPDDFVGVMEPDYFAEALHKRLLFADVPLSVMLRYAPPRAGTLTNLDTSVLVGDYKIANNDSDFGSGSIAADGDNLTWTNDDGESWTLTWDGENGRLLTGPENSYSTLSGGDAFTIALARDENGDYTDQIIGFRFLSDLYLKQ